MIPYATLISISVSIFLLILVIKYKYKGLKTALSGVD